MTANSRMIYAFSRDGALPGSRFWHRINPRTRTPTNAIWLAAGGAFVLGLPYLWNTTAYAAVTSIAVIGLYIAYVIPTFLRLRPGDEFQRGPVAPGPLEPADRHRRGRPGSCSSRSCSCCRTVSPVTVDNFNYTLVAVAGRARLRRDLVAGLGPELVHRAEGAGQRRRSSPPSSTSWRASSDGAWRHGR